MQTTLNRKQPTEKAIEKTIEAQEKIVDAIDKGVFRMRKLYLSCSVALADEQQVKEKPKMPL